MAVTGITDAMVQYEKNTESIYKSKPKNSKPHGIKMPDSTNIIALLAGLFFVFAVIAQLM
jgi:hypothetical protein